MTLALLRRLRLASAVAPEERQIEEFCQGDVYRYALRRLSCPLDAEDVAGEVYVVAHETRWRPGLELRPYLIGIAKRKVADRLRRQARRPESPMADCASWIVSADDPESDALRAEAVEKIRELLLALPDLQREALLLQYAEELSIAEIATVMGKSPSAVNSLLGRAREAIRLGGGHYFEDHLK